VAKKLGRRFTGIERDADYAAIARARIADVRPADTEALQVTASKREEPRIPFGWLVERGLLRPGEVLTDPTGRWTARVRADGTLATSGPTGDHRGSIHQVGAAVQGAPACNGWAFWCVNLEGKRVSIDVLRQKLRAELT
jgi:modification methylase